MGNLMHGETGSRLEHEFLGGVNKNKADHEAYYQLYGNPVDKETAVDAKIAAKYRTEKEIEQAFIEIQDYKDQYINFREAMALVEKCQIGDPEHPKRFFAASLYKYLRERFDPEKYDLKFFTAVGGTHLDVLHGVDCFFKIYQHHTDQEVTFATIDLTANIKSNVKADVLLGINSNEKDKYDPSPVNREYDEQFFTNKIQEFGEQIAMALVENARKLQAA